MNKHALIWLVVGIVAVIGGAFLVLLPVDVQKEPSIYTSEKFGIQFSYPEKYFVVNEVSMEGGERNQYAIVLAEDTPENRALFSDPNSATEGPPTITVTLFQNNLDNYTLQSFVEGTNFSNFKLSDGTKTEVTIGGEPAWRYRATGLYENENIVVARPAYVYMFTAFFNSPTDQILTDFEDILKTVTFLPISVPSTEPTTVNCLPEQRNVDACIEIYQPVCATVQIQCIKAPCDPIQQTFPNSCNACKNSLVSSYVAGECAG